MAKRSRKKVLWILIVFILIIAAIATIYLTTIKTEKNKQATVKVKKIDIIDKALAIGAVEPVNEIAVKSKISGVVGKLFVQVGDFTRAGEPILEVRPDPTPLELAEAKRSVEMATIELSKVQKELARQRQLKERGLISDQEYETLLTEYDEAALRHQITIEKLDLLEKGKVVIAETKIETVIKAPIAGYILEKSVNVGDPVVPLTSYQAGTELIKMANMENLIFKGTVDEIDVGKIAENMPAELQIGALPGKNVKGKVILISLKAQKQDNTTLFPVEISIDETNDAVLRAGYSANATIIIEKKEQVLAIPERVVTFRNDSAFVRLPDPENEEGKEQYIETGLSDAINIEVKSGLEEGQEVLEKKVREIT